MPETPSTFTYPIQRFDRHAIAAGKKYWQINGLRQCGRKRREIFNRQYGTPGACVNHYRHWSDGCRCGSSSLRALYLGHSSRPRGVYVDLGCGDSADSAIAMESKHFAFSVDLLPPSPTGSEYYIHDPGLFIQGDIAERIPFGDSFVDYASCHAVIDLIETEARPNFYAEVFRILKPGGWFAMSLQALVGGYGSNIHGEKSRAREAGFIRYRHNVPGGGSTLLFGKPK